MSTVKRDRLQTELHDDDRARLDKAMATLGDPERVAIRKAWTEVARPGYFGRHRDTKIAEYNTIFGEGNWSLFWKADGALHTFVQACKLYYEEAYFVYLKDRKDDLDFICSYGECIDNAPTNVHSGLDYEVQEAFSTHIQDIAVRNVLNRLGLKFQGPSDRILVIRSKDSDGFRFGPGNVPFHRPEIIIQPSKSPRWSNEGSVEDFWQSNKVLCRFEPEK